MKKVIKFIINIPGPSVYLSIEFLLKWLFFIFVAIPFMASDWYQDESDISIIQYYKDNFKSAKQMFFDE